MFPSLPSVQNLLLRNGRFTYSPFLAAQRKGMDGVFNHVGDSYPQSDVAYGFPYRWFYQAFLDCPYAGRFGGVFPGLQDLDYHNPCTQEFIRDVCLYWMDDFLIDGIRFDNTVNSYLPNDRRGLAARLGQSRRGLLVRRADHKLKRE